MLAPRQCDESHPQLGTDETYSLDVTAEGEATLQAPTIYGLLHALETLSQLVTFDFSAGQHVIKNAPWHIEDGPRFPHRGLMVDTARHFQPLEAIRRIIDSISYAKLNVRVILLPAGLPAGRTRAAHCRLCNNHPRT